MRIKTLVAAMAAVASLAPVAAQAQSSSENPWMIRVRAVDLLWQNGQSGAVQSLDVKAKNQIIPELDVSYFFTKNIATELVLTYPQDVQINAGGNKLGTIKALPPSLFCIITSQILVPSSHMSALVSITPFLAVAIILETVPIQLTSQALVRLVKLVWTICSIKIGV